MTRHLSIMLFNSENNKMYKFDTIFTNFKDQIFKKSKNIYYIFQNEFMIKMKVYQLNLISQ